MVKLLAGKIEKLEAEKQLSKITATAAGSGQMKQEQQRSYIAALSRSAEIRSGSSPKSVEEWASHGMKIKRVTKGDEQAG